MVDIELARILFENASKKSIGKDELIAHLKRLNEAYFSQNPIEGTEQALKEARALCQMNIDELLAQKTPLFDRLLGNEQKNQNTVLSRIDEKVLNVIKNKNEPELSKILKGQPEAKTVQKKDDSLKVEQKENYHSLSKMLECLSTYKSDPTESHLRALLDEIVKIEKDGSHLQKITEDIDTVNYLRGIINNVNFPIEHQKIVSQYLNKKYSNEGFVLFDRILQPKIKDYELQVVKEVSQASVNGKSDETAIRNHFLHIIQNIKPEEFHDLAWGKQDGKVQAPNVYALSEEIGKLTNLIKQEILLAPTKEKREEIFKKYCDILAVAIDNHDTGIINAISTAFTSAEISKLKIYESMQDKQRILAVLNLAEKIVVPFSSYKFQRAFEREAGVKPPIVKGITTLLNDLTFAHDGNLDEAGKVTKDGQEIMNRIIGEFLNQNKAIEKYLEEQNYDPANPQEIIAQVKTVALIFDSATAYARTLEILEQGSNVTPTKVKYFSDRFNSVNKQCESNSKALRAAIDRCDKVIEEANLKIVNHEFDAAEVKFLQKYMLPSEAILSVIENAKSAEAVMIAALQLLNELEAGSEQYKEVENIRDRAKETADNAWAVVKEAQAKQADLKVIKKNLADPSQIPAPVPPPTQPPTSAAGTTTAVSPAATTTTTPAATIPAHTAADFAIALENAKHSAVTRKRSSKSPSKQAAQAAVQKVQEQSFETKKLIFELNDFERVYQEKRRDLENNPTDAKLKDDIVAMENKLRSATVHVNKSVREKAFELINKLEILGKPESTYFKQLLSGFKDPTQFDANSPPQVSVPYTEDELVKRAGGIAELLKVETLFDEFYDYYNSLLNSQNKEVVLKNAAILLNQMIRADYKREYFPDFENKNDPIVAKFEKFINDNLANDRLSESQKGLLESLASAVTKASDDVSKDMKKAQELTHEAQNVPAAPFDIRKYIQEDLAKNDITEENIHGRALMLAVDLRNMFIEQLVAIKSSDFHDKAWSRKKNQDVTIHAVYANTTVFTNLMNTIAKDILEAKSVEHQMKIAALYIKTLENAMDSGDFTTGLAITSVFAMAGISRLNYIREDPKLLGVLERADKLYAPGNRYADCRAEIEKLKREGKQPIPFLNVLLTDLTFTYDGNPDTKTDPENPNRQVINDKKVGLIGALHLSHAQIFQDMLSQPVKHKVTNYSTGIKFVQEEEINAKSDQFYSKSKLDGVTTLVDFLKLFPNGEMPTKLRVIVGGAEHLDSDAFQILIERGLPLFSQAQLMDKYADSAAHTLLKSMIEWAKVNNVYDDAMEIKLNTAIKQLEPKPEDLALMVTFYDYADKFVQRYAQSSNVEREALKMELSQIISRAKDDSV
ncbi:MAG: RasGEF domain-containing protein, partial [Candidatus Berkiella sp.]